MFAAADLAVLNKTDLPPYGDFDPARLKVDPRRLDPDVEVRQVPATTGENLEGLPSVWLTPDL